MNKEEKEWVKERTKKDKEYLRKFILNNSNTEEIDNFLEKYR